MTREGEGEEEEEEDKGGRDPIQGGLQLQVPASRCRSLQVALRMGTNRLPHSMIAQRLGGAPGGLRRRGALEEHQAHGPCRQERMR